MFSTWNGSFQNKIDSGKPESVLYKYFQDLFRNSLVN